MHLVGPPSTDPVQTNTNNYLENYNLKYKTVSNKHFSTSLQTANHILHCDRAYLCLSRLIALIVFVDRVKSQLHRATNIYCCPFPYTFPWNVHTVFPVPTNSTHQSPIMIFACRDKKCGTMTHRHLLEKVETTTL